MITASVEGDIKELNKLLAKVPGLIQAAAFDDGLAPAARPVKKRVKELTPRSSETGSTDKWSQATKQKRQGEAALHREVGSKVVRKHGVVLIGYRWPKGNKGHFVIPMQKTTRKEVLWGRVTGREVRKGDDVLKRSFDETKPAVEAAFVKGVSAAVERRLARLPRA